METIVVVVVIIIIIIIIGSNSLEWALVSSSTSAATSILGIRSQISTTQFPCVFLYPVNPF